MKYLTILILLFLFSSYGCTAQENQELNEHIVYHINSNVKNADADYFKEIDLQWKSYLNSYEFVRTNSEYWNYDKMAYPDYSYISILMEINSTINNNEIIQCTTLGIVPVENNYYLLKTMFTKQSENKTDLNHILSVYAKKINDKYQFYNSTQYLSEIYENKQVGDINYIIHPRHQFKDIDAKRMNEFNQTIATLFEVEAIAFDYILANNTSDLSGIIGLDFFSYSYQPIQSGGMADNYNRMIYAGNNSAYYPHEVVHLYTNLKFPRQYHSWVDEGIATYFGGSTGYELEWHLQKLKAFLIANPDYQLKDLSELQTLIPNGEYMTDFRYAIGGFLMKEIYNNEGMEGLFDALQAGRSEDDYFALLKNKLGIERNQFEDYIRNGMHKLKTIESTELDNLKY